MASEETRLLLAWRAGDRDAGEVLIGRIAGWLARFFATKHDGGVADLVQATLAACVLSRDRFDENRSFRAYVLGIARNQLLMAMRKAGRERKALAQEAEWFDFDTSPSDRMHRSHELKLLLWALRRIDIDLQILVELHYWEEMTAAEMAGVLEIPVGTVKSRLGRAKRELRRVLARARADEIVVRSTLGGFEHWARDLGEIELRS